MPKKVAIGTVMTDKMSKSRRVEIPRIVHHSKYGKIIHRKTVCHIHDENNESHVGDMVEIIECPPKSKLKRWQLVRIVNKSTIVDLAAMRAAEKVIDDQGVNGSGNAKADSSAKSEAKK